MNQQRPAETANASQAGPVPSTTRAVYWDWEPATDRMLWSGRTRALTGLIGELPATRAVWEQFIHSDDLAPVRHAIARLLQGGVERADTRFRVRTAGQGYVAVEDRVFAIHAAGARVRLIGTLKPADVEAVAAEEPSLLERLRESEHRFQTFVESLPLLAWEMDADGWIAYYNRPWYEYTGTTSRQMEGWGWVSVHDPNDLPRMLKVFRGALESGRPWEDEFKLRRADGVFRWHLSRAVPLRDSSGRIVRWFGTNTDIHDQKLAQQERDRLFAVEHRLRQDAESASRLKDEFLAVVSHELRSPLSAVLGWVQLLQSGNLSEEKRAAALDKVAVNGRFLGRLIEDLLDVSRIIGGKLDVEREPVDLLVAVERALEAVRSDALARHVDIEYVRPATACAVIGNVGRLQQIVMNVLSNAVKFSRPGQSVHVEVDREGPEFLIGVRDEGEGIDPAFLPMLFGRFTQADSSSRRRHGGLGLGLSIADHLTRLHGGCIEASSPGRGHGATFVVRLPVADMTAPSVDRPPEVSLSPVSLNGLKVLGIDDDAEVREVLASALLAAGATVTLAASVGDAMEALGADVPDVVLSDISMPGVDGYGLMDRLRQSSDSRLRGVPVIAVTAAASVEDRSRAMASGFSGYVTKPFEIAELAATVLSVLRRQGDSGGRLGSDDRAPHP